MTTLEEWNRLPEREAAAAVLACCGSRAFAARLVGLRPFMTTDSLLAAADTLWRSLGESDWLEAFACHPRIGESTASGPKQFSKWSSEEQATARAGEAPVLRDIAAGNEEYERRHGFRYIVFASGKSAEELLATLDRRLGNPTEVEIREAAENQRQITHLRIRKWLTT